MSPKVRSQYSVAKYTRLDNGSENQDALHALDTLQEGLDASNTPHETATSPSKNSFHSDSKRDFPLASPNAEPSPRSPSPDQLPTRDNASPLTFGSDLSGTFAAIVVPVAVGAAGTVTTDAPDEIPAPAAVGAASGAPANALQTVLGSAKTPLGAPASSLPNPTRPQAEYPEAPFLSVASLIKQHNRFTANLEIAAAQIRFDLGNDNPAKPFNGQRPRSQSDIYPTALDPHQPTADVLAGLWKADLREKYKAHRFFHQPSGPDKAAKVHALRETQRALLEFITQETGRLRASSSSFYLSTSATNSKIQDLQNLQKEIGDRLPLSTHTVREWQARLEAICQQHRSIFNWGAPESAMHYQVFCKTLADIQKSTSHKTPAPPAATIATAFLNGLHDVTLIGTLPTMLQSTI